MNGIHSIANIENIQTQSFIEEIQNKRRRIIKDIDSTVSKVKGKQYMHNKAFGSHIC